MNTITFPLKQGMKGSAIADLQDALQVCLDRGALLANNPAARADLSAGLKRERVPQGFGDFTRKAVSSFQQERHLVGPNGAVSGEVDEATATALNALLKQWGLLDQPTQPPSIGYQVTGRVASRVSASVSGLVVSIVDKGVGGDVTLTQTNTDGKGAFKASFSDDAIRKRGKQQPDLQARVYKDNQLLGASEVSYNAAQLVTLNVILDDQAASSLASEHEALTNALSSQFTGKLGDLKETDTQQDITYLANKTGWDARMVALAALADQFSSRTVDATGTPAIPQPFFYALFRAGLPANEDTIYHTDAKALTDLWNKAVQLGVIPKGSVSQIAAVVGRFQALSAQKLLTGPALSGVSSFKEMLDVSALTPAQQATFAQLYTANRSDLPAFWNATSKAFAPDIANRLQVDGKLGFLTVNNAALMRKLKAAGGTTGLSDMLQLVALGLHRADGWNQLLTADVPIPNEIPGDTLEARRASYASFLAAQLRLSYPTATVAQMVKSGDLPLTGAASGVSDQVHAFLAEHQGKFEIGLQPVQQYIAKNQVQVADETVRQVKRLQRVYQITPSDQAMIGLMTRGVDAAYHIVRYDKDSFVQSFSADLGGADAAALTYARAAQIHNNVMNIALGYLYARTAPAIGVHSPPKGIDPTPTKASDVMAAATSTDSTPASDAFATATLETLFGSMDFCACEHCRSILSPAAYLVDLLLFLDRTVPAEGTASPQAILLERRPDIQYLPLTCENTNTALPYIDVVNETLEYFVTNVSHAVIGLTGYQGHDTGDMEMEDLLANPQFVQESAYSTVLGQTFPPPLPFHKPLESLRRYFDKFETPLPLVMERLRKNDSLDAGSNPYGWRDILIEEIKLSRAEYNVLSRADNPPLSLWTMYGLPEGTPDTEATAGLSNAKQYARLMNISYDDLVAILRTQFINPNSYLIAKLERLGVSLSSIRALKDNPGFGTDFDDLWKALAVPPDPIEFGGDIRAWVTNDVNYARIMGLITLAVPTDTWGASRSYILGNLVRPTHPTSESTLFYECTTAGTSATTEPAWPTIPGNANTDGSVSWTCRDASSCLNFDKLAFRYADPAKINQNIDAVVFVRFSRFIRLWKKLGWTIEQTDAAICALYRADSVSLGEPDVTDIAHLDAGFQILLPRLGIIARVLKALDLTVNRDLFSLLACWSDIGTHGDTALYRRMFLNPAMLQQDPIFSDNGYGEFLRNSAGGFDKLAPHAEAVRSALHLSGDEYTRIIGALDYLDADLTIPNVSAIYRRGWLARLLKLSVQELLLLIRCTGLDPFTLPNPTQPAILRLITILQSLKDQSLKASAALYLIWNQDLSGKSAPDSAQMGAAARTLRLGFAGVETEFAIVDDPDGTIAQSRLAVVYGADAAGFFFGLLKNTLTVATAYSDVTGTFAPGAARQAIESAAGLTETGASKIAYDDFRKTLTYVGVLTATARDSIKRDATSAGADATAFGAAVDDLYNRNQAAIGAFFSRYPELRVAFDAYMNDTAHSASEKRTILLDSILPDLLGRRKQQQAIQVVSTLANSALVFAQTILNPSSAPYSIHAVGDTTRPALDDFLQLETLGLSVQFFASDTASGTIIPSTKIHSQLDYGSVGNQVGNSLPANPLAGAAISGIWQGLVESPDSGFFDFLITTDPGATVTLLLDDQRVELGQTGNVWSNTSPIEFKAGTLHSIQLTVEKVLQILRVEWAWEPNGQGRAVIPARYLYPSESYGSFEESYVRFLKAASFATGLGLTATEMAFLATSSVYQIDGDGWLNVVPGADSTAPSAPSSLLIPLEALLAFARIKAEVSPRDDSLVTVLSDPTKATQSTDSLLFKLTRWNAAELTDACTEFGLSIADLANFEVFRRAYDAIALARKMGVSTSSLFQATTNDPVDQTVRDLQAALHARYDAANWRDVVKPINDEMRRLQRDALVAYILNQRLHPDGVELDTADKLYEYLLMDVQMDTCMQTSRVRHALSSVQLFIERCLMNLEPGVSPSAINAAQWEWMRRYRVWEANRKVYLFPENWLEPELRDDKSPIFKELESELLQSDITDDSATTALLNYLSKLEELAKLEPCGMYHIGANIDDGTSEINHVVARTSGTPSKYYYRRYDSGAWTPWELIKLNIEDNPVLPVVWNGRLLLFWLQLIKQNSLDSGALPASNSTDDLAHVQLSALTEDARIRAVSGTTVNVSAILCWSEYYNGKWQSTKTSDKDKPVSLGTYSLSSFDRSTLWLQSDGPDVNQLRIVVNPVNVHVSGASYLLYNTHSLPIPSSSGVSTNYKMGRRNFHTEDTATFEVDYYAATSTGVPPSSLSRSLLTDNLDMAAIQANHDVEDSWDAPFFFWDCRHAYYVVSEHRPVEIRDTLGYGVAIIPGLKQLPLPPLIIQEPPRIIPKIWDGGNPIGSDPAITNIGPIQRVIMGADSIRQGIGSVGAVLYGGNEVGPWGVIRSNTSIQG